MKYTKLSFLTSVSELSDLPVDNMIEVAFAGRSNAGKSSAINAITGNALARISKTPGRTQLINYFKLDPARYLVDLPGYGYAKVSRETKLKWEKTLTGYLSSRQSLIGIILLMDIRHPLKPLDWQMIEWITYYELPIHILLSKSDKLKRSASIQTLISIQQSLIRYKEFVSVQLFSRVDLLWINEARIKLDTWLGKDNN